ncbi:uncharacterized protein LOC122657468 [Telopea speciosissima]|uniref:uncharacterized protein LOC122657468 n=1 Tax=Telopea speciosissima TaxID=54955 RepID=UPI001CC79018|nr:uncharacterized protein LOC122657468 [Telopea speciosissima]
MAGGVEEASETQDQEYVYRISTAKEWEVFQTNGCIFGGDLDRTTGCIHLSKLDQVQMTLQNFFKGVPDLYLLQIDCKKLGDGLVYEAVDDGSNFFPHFYGPSRCFIPLPLDAVAKAEKLNFLDGKFSCSFL